MNQEIRKERMCDSERKTDVKKYPWFTVLIADGKKDNQDDIMYLGRGTTIIKAKEVPAIMANRDDCVIGSVEIVQHGNQLHARFIKCDPIAEAILLDLTPSVTGKYCKKNGAFIEVIELTAISFDIGKNCDHRILSIREQRKAQDDADMSNVRAVHCE